MCINVIQSLSGSLAVKVLIFFFTSVKVSIPYCRNSLLQLQVWYSKCIKVKVQKYWHQIVPKVPKVKVGHAEGPI